MRKLIGLVFVSLSSSFSFSQSLDFGVEASSNFNFVEKIEFDSVQRYDPENIAFSIVDFAGDTSNVFLNKFTMDNHFEIPLFFRYNFRKRWFVDLKLSNSVNRLQMWGFSNYNDSYYDQNYYSYDDFITAANNDGFADADSSDYEGYITNARNWNESSVSTTEEFKLLSFTLNGGIRLFPHKSVKMFLAAGLTYKVKYAKHVYSHVSFSRDHIEKLLSVDKVIDKYAERSTYFNTQIGFEFYRFRLAAYFQTGIAYTFDSPTLGPEITYNADNTPFDVIRTYGFSMSANLFSLDLGKRVKKDEVSKDDMIISNIEAKKDKWDLGVRYDRRGYNDLTTFYENPDQELSILRRDTILYLADTSFVQGLQVQMITLGRVKRIQWGGRLNGVFNFYLTKRLGLRAVLGGSRLVFDVETNELNATINGNDSIGYSYLSNSSTPRLKSAVYRKPVNILDLSIGATYKVIDRDLFSLGVNAGFGIAGLGYIKANKKGLPAGVNELDVYDDLDDFYSGIGGTGLQFYQGELDVHLNEDPKNLLDKFDDGVEGLDESAGAAFKLFYTTFNIGVEANIERYTVGLAGQFNISPMDSFILNGSSSIYMSLGYKLFKR